MNNPLTNLDFYGLATLLLGRPLSILADSPPSASEILPTFPGVRFQENDRFFGEVVENASYIIRFCEEHPLCRKRT